VRVLPIVAVALILAAAAPADAGGAPKTRARSAARKSPARGRPPRQAPRRRAARPPRFGVAYLGRRVEDIDEIARHADWVLLPMDEAATTSGAAEVRKLAARARERGLEVWLDPWRVGDVFAGETETTLHQKYPRQRQISSDGVARASLSPLSPAFRRFMIRWLDLAAEVGADGVFWDEPHYWTGEWIGDPTVYASIDRWHRKRFGKPMPASKTEEVARFQLEVLSELLLELTAEARKRGLKVYADFTPRPEHEVLWRRLAGAVDGLGVSAYEDPARDVRRLLKSAPRDKAHVWLQGFRLERGRERELVKNARRAFRLGARELAVWSYRGSADFAGLASEDPDAAWQATVEAFDAVRAAARRGARK
jgi:hypothetical protein